MSATMRVHGSVVVGARSMFAVRGVVVAGELAVGQRVTSPEGFDATVFSIERTLRDPGGGTDNTAIIFRYANAAQLARWRALVPAGTELVLADTR
ncbi:MAG: hypothetical protein ABJD07_09715 [Gemmatimonadaceae bacterium]